MTLADTLASRSDRCSLGFAIQQHPRFCKCAELGEYAVFLRILVDAVRADGTLHVNDTRTPLRDHKLIQPKHVGPMWQRARAEKLIRQLGLEDSTDAEGHNTHQTSRYFAWLGSAAA